MAGGFSEAEWPGWEETLQNHPSLSHSQGPEQDHQKIIQREGEHTLGYINMEYRV